MSGSKYFDRIAIIVTAITMVITVLFMNGAALGIEVMETAMGYENRLFDTTKVHSVDIVMNDWDDMIDNAASEEYYTANVVIDGESYKNVGIRTKGNTSLSTVAMLGSERYSFKIEFDHYDSSKTYHGLDKLSLNNLICDSTMMKDYLTYTMMNAFDVDSSLCSYVYVTVNGEDWGLYLAVEGVEESFLERNYGSDFGELYKPDNASFGGGRGNGGDFDMSDFNFDFGGTSGDPSNGNAFDPSNMHGSGMPNMPSAGGASVPDEIGPSDIPEDFDPSTVFVGNGENGGGFGGSMGMGSDDVKLQYIDDDLSSYSNIWDNAKTDVTKADKKRLVESLKKLSCYEEIESVVDVEQVIRYFVVHNYVCNGDSYTGSMVHNYYLYEKDGKLSMIPWDYNLAFGTFQGSNATNTVNTPIDSPVDNGSNEDRPMWNWIVSDEEYTETYHRYFSEFLSSVDIAGIIDNAYHLIKDYVAKDPTAFYSYEEFELGIETIRQFCALRSESISMQLESGETTSNMNYADASGIALSDMGTMKVGTVPNMPDDSKKFNDSAPDHTDAQIAPTAEGSNENNVPSGFSGEIDEIPDGFDPTDLPMGGGGNFPDPSFGSGNGNMPSGDMGANGENGNNRPNGGNMQMPGGTSSDPADNALSAADRTAWIRIGISVVVLAVGLLIAKRYRA